MIPDRLSGRARVKKPGPTVTSFPSQRTGEDRGGGERMHGRKTRREEGTGTGVVLGKL